MINLMSKPPKILLLVACVLQTWLFPLKAQDAPVHKPIVPLEPAELIKFLPEAPKGWSLKESKAKSTFAGWLLTFASREFTYTPPVPANAAPGTPPPPTQITRIKITDTGYYPASLGQFENFKVGKYGNEDSLLISGLTARKITFPDGERLSILVKGRFIVQIEVRKQRPNIILEYPMIINFSKLVAIPDSGAEELPKPVVVSSVDELHPKNNSRSELQWMSKKEMEEIAKKQEMLK